MRVTTAGVQLADFATGLPGSAAFALRILPGGGVLVADTSAVLLLDATGTIIHTYPVVGASELFSLNINPVGRVSGPGTMEPGYFTNLTSRQPRCLTPLTLGLEGETSSAFPFTANSRQAAVEWETRPRSQPLFRSSPLASVRLGCWAGAESESNPPDLISAVAVAGKPSGENARGFCIGSSLRMRTALSYSDSFCFGVILVQQSQPSGTS